MKQNKQMSANRRRGFSMMEVVISMAIVITVSISAISLQVTMIKEDTKVARNSEIVQYADDVLDCFNWASNSDSPNAKKENFQAAMKKLGFTLSKVNSDGQILFEQTNLTNVDFDVYINFETQPNQLEINVTTPQGEEIYRFAYEK